LVPTASEHIAADDLPNHIVRVYEARRTFPNDAPVINGLKLVEEWDRGAAELTDCNGTGTQITEHVMENGDKFFDRGRATFVDAPGTFNALPWPLRVRLGPADYGPARCCVAGAPQ
jgi:hypothetical protein